MMNEVNSNILAFFLLVLSRMTHPPEKHSQGHILLKNIPPLGWYYSLNHIHVGRERTSIGRYI